MITSVIFYVWLKFGEGLILDELIEGGLLREVIILPRFGGEVHFLSHHPHKVLILFEERLDAINEFYADGIIIVVVKEVVTIVTKDVIVIVISIAEDIIAIVLVVAEDVIAGTVITIENIIALVVIITTKDVVASIIVTENVTAPSATSPVKNTTAPVATSRIVAIVAIPIREDVTSISGLTVGKNIPRRVIVAARGVVAKDITTWIGVAVENIACVAAGTIWGKNVSWGASIGCPTTSNGIYV